VKIITIKSSVLAVAVVIMTGVGDRSHAGVFDQIAAMANSALPAYGREHALSFRPDLPKRQIDAGIREALVVASDRVVQQVVADSGYFAEGESQLSSDMRQVQKTAVRLGLEESFEQLTQQINQAVIAAVPVTGKLLKAAVRRVELSEPRGLLASHETAATDFLRRKVSANLHRQLQPLVTDLLKRTGAASTSAMLASEIQFGSLLDTITENQIIEQSIDGFFDKLEEQEVIIRQDPASRPTKLLRKVFG